AVVLVYLALEPTIRRRAPEVLVGSTRLLAGRFRDPRVGRDLLAGLVMGLATAAACALLNRLSLGIGHEPLAIYGLAEKLSGFGGTVYWMTFSFFLEVSGSLLLCLLYALLVAWWKRKALAGLGLLVAAAVIGGGSPIAWIGALLFVLCLARFGILATVVSWTCVDWVLFFPTGAEPGDWWLPLGLVPSAVLALLALYAAYAATGSALRAHQRRTGDSRFGRSGLGSRSRSRAPHRRTTLEIQRPRLTSGSAGPKQRPF
ncbi:MAG: hypothetical protein MI919_14380, partial [Holophagales bacterium]|nr:hypothetical protein [Holophagales bacterium]